jgi:dihydroflavonol-4-reductase
MLTRGVVMVTGATGHLGNVLVRELLNRGASVRAMVLPGESREALAGLDVECIEGDVRDMNSLKRGFAGCSIVFHLAGLISIMPGQSKLLREVNVIGTRNVLRACKECGIVRMLYVSSVHALEEPPHGAPVTEQCGFDPDRIAGPYAQSKAQATQEVMRAIAQGLDAVIVFPSGIIGPYDFSVSEMGRVVLDFVNRRFPVYVEGAYDFVDVRDVANGIISAAERGGTGQGYILSGEILSVSRMVRLLEEKSGVPAPSVRLPQWVARGAAVFTPLLASVTGKKPRFTSYSLRVLRSNALMDCSKARRELGYTARPVKESLADSLEWLRGRIGRTTG